MTTSSFGRCFPRPLPVLVFLLVCGLRADLRAADFLERLGLKQAASSASAAATGLSQEQVLGGLREALASGVQHAVTNLGRADGFLKDVNVRIPLPSALQSTEKALRRLGQQQLADQFITTMNRAAEQAVPEAAAVLADSVRQMSVADAKAILTSTNTAATEYFKRTSETNLFTRLLPIVKKTTGDVGVTAAYKQMVDKVSGGFGGFASSFLKPETLDLDSYVTHKALDGLFLKIADQEKLIRENPAARATDVLQKVFGSITR
jgi:hypothetical protein